VVKTAGMKTCALLEQIRVNAKAVKDYPCGGGHHMPTTKVTTST